MAGQHNEAKGSPSKHRLRTIANMLVKYVHTRRQLNREYETQAKNITDATIQETRDNMRNNLSGSQVTFWPSSPSPGPRLAVRWTVAQKANFV